MGFWTDITKIEVPASAKPGQVVDVKVTVKNKTNSAQWLVVTGYYDSEPLPQPLAQVAAGASYIFTLPFTMPSRNVVLRLWSYIWVIYPDQPGYWQDDDYKTVSISLEFAPVITEFGILDYVKV